MDALFLSRLLCGINAVMGIIVFAMNLHYFITVKNKWRWIKLAYAVNGLIITTLIVLSLNGLSVSPILYSLEVFLLLSTLLGGSFVSLAKLDAVKHMDKSDGRN